MELQTHFKKLLARLCIAEDYFISFQSSMPSRLDHSHWMFLEGLSSATWQYWGTFCRSVVIDSALGARTAGGLNLTPCAGSWEEVSHIASRVTSKKKLVPGGTNSELRLEPTWGDPGKLNIVITALDLTNKETLASTFGADSYITHLQTVRNAAAHRHHQNTANVLALRPYYQVSRLRHPSEALLWLEEQSKSFAFLFWLEDMRMLGSWQFSNLRNRVFIQAPARRCHATDCFKLSRYEKTIRRATVKLETVHVTNFRSAEDSEEFSVGPVTCLVGKNEAGKSAILLALAALNPHTVSPAVFDKERDYPRRSLIQYGEKHKDAEAIAIKTTWQLDLTEMEQIAAVVGPEVMTSNIVTISRRYQKPIEVEVKQLDYKQALEFLYSKFALDASERATLMSATTTSDLIKLLGTLAAPSPNQLQLKAHLDQHGPVTVQTSKLINGMLPKFMYFSSYDRMDGAIQIEHTNQLIANGQISDDTNRGVRLFVEFLKYAGITIGEIASVATYETFNAKLQAASNNITDQILEYWTQNPDLSVVVRVEQARSGDPAPLNSGTVARARIHNDLHRVDTPFSERSAGFVWFFSFLVKFAQVKDEASPVVLLLDEPGLTLHGKAQADLLRFFKEKLAPHHQIIYSTHSPFMVPADDLSSVRIVQDQVELKGQRRIPLGTKVRDDVLSRDPDTLFPLQGALGYEISQSLFVGKNTLLVEGPGDILYIQALSDALRRKGRVGLDPQWTLCPAGGIDKIRPFVALFSGNALNVAVLSDQATGDKKKVEEMKRSQVLGAAHFYTMADFMERAEADIEDIFEPELFASIVNGCYALDEKCQITAEKLKAADKTTERLVKQTEAVFKVFPDTVPMFDHFTPAAWLIRNSKVLDGKSPGVALTLERAEKIFITYNQML